MSIATIPAVKIVDIDLLDGARDKLRTVHVALSPEAGTHRDDLAMMAIWATMEGIITDLNHLRDHLCDRGRT